MCLTFAAHAFTSSAISVDTKTTQNVAVGGISPQSVDRSLIARDAFADLKSSELNPTSSILLKDSKYPDLPFQAGIAKSALGNVDRNVGQQVASRSESDSKAWAGIANIPNQLSAKISTADSAKGNIDAYQAFYRQLRRISNIGNGVSLCQ